MLEEIYTNQTIETIPQFEKLSIDRRLIIKAVSLVFPFQTNRYILEELINWDDIPHDPIFQINFPHEGMLPPDVLDFLCGLLSNNTSISEIKAAAQKIRMSFFPAPIPSEQKAMATIDGRVIPGLWHEFREVVLAFPSHARRCFAICNHCLRWIKHCGIGQDYCFNHDNDDVRTYFLNHPEITDIQITGGDPFTMPANMLYQYIKPLLTVESLRTFRFTTRCLTWWPYRFICEQDSDELLRLLEDINKAGKHVSFVAHICHPQELSTATVVKAIQRIRSTGAVIRCQGPLLGHVNDTEDVLVELWNRQVALGMVPYYLFGEDGAGPKDYFKKSLSEIVTIFQKSQARVSGLARTVRGVVFYFHHNKILLDDICEFNNKKYFILKIVQSMNPLLVGKTFFAHYDESATRFDQLKPALNGEEFFKND